MEQKPYDSDEGQDHLLRHESPVKVQKVSLDGRPPDRPERAEDSIPRSDTRPSLAVRRGAERAPAETRTSAPFGPQTLHAAA